MKIFEDFERIGATHRVGNKMGVGGIVLSVGGVGKVETSGVFVPQLTIEELRAQFEDLPTIKPYLNSNEIMEGFIDGMFCFYLECAKANNILREG